MNPCFGCNERNEDCHGVCEKYLNWKDEHDEQKRQEWIDDQKRKFTRRHECDIPRGRKKRWTR